MITAVPKYLIKSIFAICFISLCSNVAGEIFEHRESISEFEARDLGIAITRERIRWLDVDGRQGIKGQTVEAIRYSIYLPLLVNGEPIEGGDFEVEDSCTLLDQRAEVETEDDYSAYTKFNMTHIIAADCVGKVAYWADYGSQPGTLYWITLAVE